MKRGACCAAVVIVALTGCRMQEAPPADTTASAPAPALLSADALERAPVFTSLEEALREPEKVYRLDLGARPDALKSGTLLAKVGRLVNLQELKLNGLGLTEVPRELGQLRGLQHLDLSGNRLRALPEELEELRALETLALAGNELQHFPGFIVALPALRTLTLHANPFQVSLALGQVTTLSRVDLGAGQGDLEALREALPRVRWEVHTEGASAKPPPASSEELEMAWPEPQEEPEPEPEPTRKPASKKAGLKQGRTAR